MRCLCRSRIASEFCVEFGFGFGVFGRGAEVPGPGEGVGYGLVSSEEDGEDFVADLGVGHVLRGARRWVGSGYPRASTKARRCW